MDEYFLRLERRVADLEARALLEASGARGEPERAESPGRIEGVRVRLWLGDGTCLDARAPAVRDGDGYLVEIGAPTSKGEGAA